MFRDKPTQRQLDNERSIELCKQRVKRNKEAAKWSCIAAGQIQTEQSKESCLRHTNTLINSIFDCQRIKEEIWKEQQRLEHYEDAGRIRTPAYRRTGDRNI